MGFLSGKRALIVGVASDRSIAWGIAQAMHAQGAELAFSYVNDKFKERVQPLAESLGSKLTMQLDVTNDAEIDSCICRHQAGLGHARYRRPCRGVRSARSARGRIRREHLA
jgi:enoyl-[acyl-carrier-protein] reductase (NADH)